MRTTHLSSARSVTWTVLLALGILVIPMRGWAQDADPDTSAEEAGSAEPTESEESEEPTEPAVPNPRVQFTVSVEAEDGAVTGLGSFTLELFPDAAPKHVENVLVLVEEQFFEDCTFHRIVPGFIVQGGDPISKSDWRSPVLGTGGPGYTVPPEIERTHERGAVAAARKPDSVNPTRESSGSQFFICLADLPSLDRGGYTVFGQVTQGMETVDKIARIKNAGPQNNNRALQRVFINEVKVIE